MNLSERFQIHKYKDGHQRTQSSIELDRIDQDTVDRLSDISGQVRPGENFLPYFTCYPLPSRRHFVVARTWQDFLAPRAGCVITKSVMVPMSLWETTEKISDIFLELIDYSNQIPANNEMPRKRHFLIEPVFDSLVDELVEALFLEQRKPIVVFNCEEAENILLRLYRIFWPGIRQIFSSCSFSLSPRTISGRSFDLLFSQSDLRARFVDWKGRRIEGGKTSNSLPRHRWTKELSDKIFKNNVPSLFADGESSSTFLFNEFADESALRLNLLWNELYTKAEVEASPFAILGLLDIINSQPVFADDLYKNLHPYIDNAVANALIKLPATDAWKFYSSLLIKHKKKLMNRELLANVRNACSQLASVNPNSAISFISNFNPISSPIPSVLFAGIGDGLSKSVIYQPSLLYSLAPQLTLMMTATSRPFAKTVMDHISNNREWNDKVIEYLAIGDSKTANRAKNNLSIFINSGEHSRILEFLLNGSDEKLYKRIVQQIAKNTGFGIDSYYPSLVSETIRLSQFDFLRSLVVSYDKLGEADSLLVMIVLSDPPNLRWLLTTSSLSIERKIYVLLGTLDTLPPSVLKLINADSELSTLILRLLLKSDRVPDKVLVNILLIANAPIYESLVKLIELPQASISNIRPEHLRTFLVTAFHGQTSHYFQQLSSFLKRLDTINGDDVVELALRGPYESAKIIENIKILLNSGNQIMRSLSKNIGFTTRIIATNSIDGIDTDLSTAWINLLLNATDVEEKKKAAFIVLEFAYSSARYDPTDLLIAAFPIVYRTFLGSNSISQFFTFMLFPDWDKCRTLRNGLVSKYMDSSWSKFGLFRVAAATGILEEVVSIAIYRKGGKKYVNNAIAEGSSSNDRKQYELRRQLEKLLKK